MFNPLGLSVLSLKINFIHAALWGFCSFLLTTKNNTCCILSAFSKTLENVLSDRVILQTVVTFFLAAMGIQTLTILAE